MEQQNYMVCVSCMTYNHAPYVTDALNGFCMQETTFPFVCTIIDDASTDGEQEVIKKYLQKHFDLEDKTIVRNEETDDYILTFARHKTNKNCFFAVLYLKYNHYSIKKTKMPYVAEWRKNCKYIALCEGDDYWIYKNKLAEQVNYLQKKPEIVLSCHRYYDFNLSNGEKKIGVNPFFYMPWNSKKDLFEFNLDYAFSGKWFTKTLTIVFRKECLIIPEKFNYMRDVHIIYYLLKNGNGVCHSFMGGVYRRNQPSSIYGNLDMLHQLKIIYAVFSEFYEKTGDDLLKNAVDKNLISLVIEEFKGGSMRCVFLLRIFRLYNRVLSVLRNLKYSIR